MLDSALFDAGPRATVPGKRGRGATAVREHVMRCAGPSISGRFELTFRYRPLKGWEPALLERVERALCYYFQHVGGFRVADDAVMKHWVQLFADYDPDELRWAIDQKAASLKGDTRDESREKRQLFTPRAENFAPGIWLEKSPDYQRRQAALTTRARRDALDQVTLQTRNATAPAVPSRPSESTARAVASSPASPRDPVHLPQIGGNAPPTPTERSISALARSSSVGPVCNRSLVGSDPYVAYPPFIREAIAERRRVDIFLGTIKERVRREAGARLKRDRADLKVWFDAIDDEPDARDEFVRKCVYDWLLAREICLMHPGYQPLYARAL